MSLSKEQQQELKKLAVEFEKFEQYAIENNIDLDVFLSQYDENGYSDHGSENVSLEEKSASRKSVYAKTGRQKSAVKAK